MMKIVRLIVFMILTSVITVSSQDSEAGNNVITELAYGFGGNFYLNYLENNPMLSLRAGVQKKLHQSQSMALLFGVERLNHALFLPVLGRYTYHQKQGEFYLSVGYAFGVHDDVSLFEEFNYRGGLALGLGYAHQLFMLGSTQVSLNAGYSLRNSQLVYETTQSRNEINSRSQYHHISIGLGLRI